MIVAVLCANLQYFSRSVICASVNAQVFLVFGKSGWIGGLIGQLLKERGLKFEYANARLEDRSEVIADLERVSSILMFCS